MSLSLLVLAAGMGSRYGGLKQVDPVGPSGETLLDYSVHDAIQAGFTRIVFVIRRDFEATFRAHIGAKYAGKIAVDYVFQALDALPAGHTPLAGREKPWGTGHATWCARSAINGPFAVINADDYYGADAYRQLAAFLNRQLPQTAALAGYTLRRTLSENGLVSRGVCRVDENGETLLSITEHTGIAATEVGAGLRFSGAEVVSMNCWAFGADFFQGLDRRFNAFLNALTPEKAMKGEFYLPTAVSELIEEGALRVTVLPVDGDWFGITYREDKPRVEAALRSLIASGRYTTPLHHVT